MQAKRCLVAQPRKPEVSATSSHHSASHLHSNPPILANDPPIGLGRDSEDRSRRTIAYSTQLLSLSGYPLPKPHFVFAGTPDSGRVRGGSERGCRNTLKLRVRGHRLHSGQPGSAQTELSGLRERRQGFEDLCVASAIGVFLPAASRLIACG
eukprot:1084475-Rhodomonas_salina.3